MLKKLSLDITSRRKNTKSSIYGLEMEKLPFPPVFMAEDAIEPIALPVDI